MVVVVLSNLGSHLCQLSSLHLTLLLAGFANVFPCTTAGRAVSTGCSIIGVPMVVFVLSNLGSHLCQLTTLIYSGVRRRPTKKSLRKPRNNKNSLKHRLSFKRWQRFTSTEPLVEFSYAENDVSAVNAKKKRRQRKVNAGSNSSDGNNNESEKEDEGEIIQTPASIGLLLSIACVSLVGFYYYYFEDYSSTTATYYAIMVFLGGDLVTQKFEYALPLYGIIFIGFSMLSLTISLFQANMRKFVNSLQGKVLENIKTQIKEARANAEDTSSINVDDAVNKALESVRAPWWIKNAMPTAEIELLKDSVSTVINKKSSSAQANIVIHRRVKMQSHASTQVAPKLKKNAVSQSNWTKEGAVDVMEAKTSDVETQSTDILQENVSTQANRCTKEQSTFDKVNMHDKAMAAEPDLRSKTTEVFKDVSSVDVQTCPDVRSMYTLGLVVSPGTSRRSIFEATPALEQARRRWTYSNIR